VGGEIAKAIRLKGKGFKLGEWKNKPYAKLCVICIY
jgi:hypothetical protein